MIISSGNNTITIYNLNNFTQMFSDFNICESIEIIKLQSEIMNDVLCRHLYSEGRQCDFHYYVRAIISLYMLVQVTSVKKSGKLNHIQNNIRFG